MGKGFICLVLLLIACSSWGQESGFFESKYMVAKKPFGYLDGKEQTLSNHQLDKRKVLSPLSMLDETPKKAVRQFAIDSPFGTLLGTDQPSLNESGHGFPKVKKSYILILSLTGIGFRIEL